MIPYPIKLATAGSLALAMAALSATGVAAQERVKWKMQSACPSSLIHLGTSGVRFAKNIDRVSGGNFQIKFYEPGALVPALECFDAASQGSVQACWTTPGYNTGKIPALAFFTTVPFGPPYGEFFAWKKLPRRRRDQERNLRRARPVLDRRVRHRAGNVGLVPRGDHLAGPAEWPEDALLRARRSGDAEDGRVDPAARRRRHLSGAGAGRDRRHRVLDARRSTSASASIRSPRTTTIRAGISRSRSASC